jgi:uncharacterized protein YdbL (DUF1318 family)
MLQRSLKILLAASMFTAACVTINVYFPEAAAEQAADRIIDTVQGSAAEQDTTNRSHVPDFDDALEGGHRVLLAAVNVLDVLIPVAHAQVDFDIDTPEIRALTDSMKNRFRQLRPFFDSGAIGLTSDAMIEIRDRNAVPLAQRNKLSQLVSAENSDRNALYKAIARANGHPEWENDIRRTFAERWVAKAGGGWYYRTAGGDWRQK